MQRPAWVSEGDTWSSRAIVVGAVAGVAGILAARNGTDRLGVAAATVVTLAGFGAKLRWPGLSPLVLASWTFSPAIALNLAGRGEAAMFLLVVAVSFLVLETPDQRTRLVAGSVALLSPAVIQAIHPQDWGWPYWMVGLGFGWLSSEQMRRFRDLATELAATRELLAERAVDAERRRIAAELHDVVGHSLTVVLLSVTGARRLVRSDPDGATRALLEAEAVGRASLAEIRGSVRGLRDAEAGGPGVAPMPAAGDLPELVDRMVAAGSPVDLDIRGDVGAVEVVTGLVVYRVVQESLNNAARHAPGTPARVAVAVADDAVDVEVFDAGTGPEAAGSPGVGLLGMRERVEAVGGTFQAGPVPGGWRVRAHVPRLGSA